MYSFAALLIAVTFLLFTVAVPFRAERWVMAVLNRVRRTLASPTREALFRRVGEEFHPRWVRVWGATSSALFALFGILDGSVVQNELETVTAALLYGGLAGGLAAVLVASCVACSFYMSRSRGYAALRRCGLDALWIVGDEGTPKSLRSEITRSVAESSHVTIVSVTGAETFGRATAPGEGLLREALASASGVPVSLFLLEPESQARDPDRRQATVSQTVLAEMGLSAQAFQRQMRTTLEAITELNEERPPESLIEVHYYSEKPSFRAVLFDKSALIASLTTREHRTFFTQVRRAERNSTPSFFEIFRRQIVCVAANAGVRLPTTANEPARRHGATRIPIQKIFKAPTPTECPSG